MATPRGLDGRCWQFSGIELDECCLELRVAGRVVALERKPLQALLLLLQRNSDVVFKEEFFEIVWNGRALSDAALTKCIAVLRHAIGDAQHRIIRTVHCYGYRLMPPVRVLRHGKGVLRSAARARSKPRAWGAMRATERVKSAVVR